jgi:hypothetical protein
LSESDYVLPPKRKPLEATRFAKKEGRLGEGGIISRLPSTADIVTEKDDVAENSKILFGKCCMCSGVANLLSGSAASR